MRELTRRIAPALMLSVPLFMAACGGGDVEDEAEPAVDPQAAVATEQDAGYGAGAGTDLATTRYFTDWDLNDDTYLTQTEFDTGFGGQNARTLWEDWDLDRNQSLDENEFGSAFGNEGWYDEGLFSEWDANDDDMLETNELSTGLFDTWDVDDDNQLAETEFQTLD